MRWIAGLLALALAALILVPYSPIPIYLSLATFTAAYPNSSGLPDTVIIGRDAPQPDWLVKEPGALVLTASRWTRQSRFKDGGSVELFTHTSETGLRELYARLLHEAGFAVEDRGTAPLDAMTAQFMLIGPMLFGKDAARNLEVRVLIREPTGVMGLGPRHVQIEWRELWPPAS